MSVVQNPIIGRSSGKFSTAIFQKWKNKNVLRSKPLTVANPNTVYQQQQRNIFSALVSLGRSISPLLIVGFNGYKATLTWFNMFIKKSFEGFVVYGTAPAFTLDYSSLIISEGPMTPTAITSVTGTDSSATVTVVFPTATSAPDMAATDKMYLFVMNVTADVAQYSLGTVARSVGSIAVTMETASTSGDVLNAYLFAERADGSMVSSNLFATSTVS